MACFSFSLSDLDFFFFFLDQVVMSHLSSVQDTKKKKHTLWKESPHP